MKRNKTVLLIFLLLIASFGFWSWKKTEKDEKHAEDKSVYFLMLVESVFLTLAEEQEYSFYTDQNSWGNSTQVPLYLFNRTLLI